MLPKTKPILIEIVYRPPDDSHFLDNAPDAIDNSTNFENQEVYILGDFNINVSENSNLAKSYREICALHGLIQVIETPTRITGTSSTLIDHILTNSKLSITQHGVLEIALSDHYVIYCTRKIQKQKYHKQKFITIRSLKNYSKSNLLEKLSDIIFPDYSLYGDIDEAYSDFTNKLTTVINDVAPFKKINVKNNTGEWLDDEIFEGIRARDKLFRKFKKSKLHADGVNFRKARNRLQTMIRNKKRNFITKKLSDGIVKPKELWKTLSQLGLPSKKKANTKICLNENGELKLDSKSNCKIFKDFFETHSTNLVNNLPSVTNDFDIKKVQQYYSNLSLENKNFCLQPTTYEVVLKLLGEINPSKAAGMDKIGGKFLRDGATLLAFPVQSFDKIVPVSK